MARKLIRKEEETKSFKIIHVDKEWEHWIITDNHYNRYYITENELLKLFPKEVTMRIHKKISRTWAETVEYHRNPRKKKVESDESPIKIEIKER